LLNSYNAAVVYIEGTLPGLAQLGEQFDVKVTAVSQSTATNLEGGWLYAAELVPKGSPIMPLRRSAIAQGHVYIDRLGQTAPDPRKGLILGGGRLQVQPSLLLVLAKDDFRTSVRLRDLLEDRFGFQTARPLSPRQISITIPRAYAYQPERFVEVLEQVPLDMPPAGYAESLVARLTSGDRQAEVALEAIGLAVVGHLTGLLRSADEQARLAAARCLRNLGNPAALPALVGIAFDSSSARRLEAIDALAAAGPSTEVVEALRALLSSDQLAVAASAYRWLIQLSPTALPSQKVSDYILIDQVPTAQRPGIIALRSRQARVCLLGNIGLRSGVVLRYGNDRVVIDSRQGPGVVLVSGVDQLRKVSFGPVRCGSNLVELIWLLCSAEKGGPCLDYSDLVGLLQAGCEQGLIAAQFWAGPISQ
jgi:hypothetical protein